MSSSSFETWDISVLPRALILSSKYTIVILYTTVIQQLFYKIKMNYFYIKFKI